MINSRVDEDGNYHQIYPPRQLYMPPQGAKVEVLMNWAAITRPTFYLMHAFFEKAGLSKEDKHLLHADIIYSKKGSN